MAEESYRVEARDLAGGEVEVRLAGDLVLERTEALRRSLAEAVGTKTLARVDLSGVRRVDGAGAAVLAEAWYAAAAPGTQPALVGAPAEAVGLLELATQRPPRPADSAALPEPPILQTIGDATARLAGLGHSVLTWLGGLVLSTRAALARPRTVHWVDVPRLAERAGADGAPIVLLIALLIGIITAYQAATQMHQLGADVFVPDLVALSITRELGPLITAIVVAGRSGAAIAAELGTMTVSEEVDALRTLRLDPVRFLVLPRVIALTLMLPLLTLLAEAVAIGGGLLITTAELEMTAGVYLRSTRDALDTWDIAGGLIKAVVFGALIALISCERGLATRGGAEGVGRSTTAAVVASLFSLIAADAVFTLLYNRLGI
ncbi:MAG: MlaE family lipid ABC transporter permease subunit [Planctomycetota bacterium]|nr:MlaE family lipid ABC transporter permease subunit [Planctomycetota bacterium]